MSKRSEDRTSERTIQQAKRLLDDPFITVCAEDGGAYRDRTDDLLNANQALSQLS